MVIAQGTGQGDRVGNKIRVKKAWVNLALTTNPVDSIYNPNPIPYNVRLVFASNRQSKVLAPPLANFFQAADSSTAPTGNIYDVISDINRDFVVVKKDVHVKLASQDFASGYVPTNNDYHLNYLKTFDITSMIPKVIEYNDSNNTPMTQSTWLTILMGSALGGNYDSGNTTFKPANIYMEINLEYVDF